VRRALAIAMIVLGAWAAPARAAAPRLVIAPASLSFTGADDSQTVTLTNAGDDVLRLGNVAVATFGQVPGVVFQVRGGAAQELEAGQSATIEVTFRAPPGGPPPQVFGALIVPADDPRLPLDIDLRTGASVARRIAGVPLRMGQTHLLTWMILLPLLGAALLAVGPVGRSRRAPAVGLLGAGIPLGLAGLAMVAFAPGFSSADGNLGLQLAARLPLLRALGIEYAVGVDGASILFVLLAPLSGLAAAVAARALPAERRRVTLAALLAAQAGATGVFVAVDGTLFVFFWLLAAAGLIVLVGPRTPFAPAAAAGALLLLFASLALRHAAGPSYLCDGTPVAHAFDLVKLAHGGGLARRLGAPLLGVPAPAVVALALLAAFGVALPLFPFHAWAAPTFERASAPAALAVAGLWATMGASGFVRVALPLLPEVARRHAGLVVLLAALGALHAALLAVSARDVRRLAAHAGVLQMSFCALGLASLATAGVSGALVTVFAHGLGAIVLLSLLGAFADPARGLAELEALAAATPPAARWLSVALLASVGAPGLATFVGPAIVILDAATGHPAAAFAALGAFVLAAGAAARFGRRLFPRVAADAAPAPVLPPVNEGTLAVVVPVTALLVGLGLAPAPLLDAVGSSMIELARQLATAPR
jgi:NADH-quinone oxidoreductase subunit M